MATNYVVLKLDPDDETRFEFCDVVVAEHGPEQAVRRHTEADTDAGEQLYIAVPVRNWNVVPRRVVTPAPRVEVAEVDTEAWLTGFQRQLREIRELPTSIPPDEETRE